MKAIIVVTYEGSPWLSECINSLAGTKYPIMLCVNPRGNSAFDSAGFYYAKKHNIEEFVLMHDSMVVKDISLFDDVFALEGNIPLGEKFLMCFGKYVLNTLPPLPKKPHDKMSAIRFEVTYARKIPFKQTLGTVLKDTNKFTEKHGKKRMVLENKYVIKYKGTWSPSMVK